MKKILFILCFSFVSLSTLHAQTIGSLDSSFDSDGRVTCLSFNYETAYAMVIQPDGKILVGGRNDISASISHFIMKRYKIDGSLDSIFGTDGVVETTMHGQEDVINAIALQPDGKIVVAGTSWSDITAYDLAFARYNTNGTLDNTFGDNGTKVIDILGNNDGSHDEKVNSALAIQADGKIVAAGYIQNVISYDFMMVRLNIDGTVDASFGTNGFAITDVNDATSDAIRGIAIQPDGKIVAVGASTINSTVSFIAARYSSNGSLDATFGKSGITVGVNTEETTEDPYAVLLQPDGKIVSVGIQQRNPGTWRSAQLIRYNSNGTYDTTFGKNGVAIVENTEGYDEIYSCVLQPDGKIVMAGNTLNTNSLYRDFLLIRVNANGAIDNTFGNGGKITTDFESHKDDMAYAIARQNDGKILAAGLASIFFTNNGIAIARYNTELTVGIKDLLDETGLAIYPNPATSEITVVTPKQSISQNSIVAIYNTQGQLLTQKPIFQERTVVDISNLANGFYILKQNGNDISKVTRFVKR
jgi:uncharacterized delta-60 repeat protein